MAHIPVKLCLSAILGLAAVSSALAADDPDAGKFKCYTRAGREIPGDAFKLGKDGQYGNKANPAQGGYQQDGRNIYFRGGSLDGTSALALPDGGIKVGKYSFCYPASDKGGHAITDQGN